MKAEPASTRTSIQIARTRLEGWLASHEPQSISEFADRVFARTVQVRDEYSKADLSSLLIDRERFLDPLRHEIRAGAVCTHLVDALRLAWVFRREGLPRHELEAIVEPLVERFRHAADAWEEPERSDFFHWANRLGWADRAVPLESEDPQPFRDLAALLRQCDFGGRTIPRAQATLHLGLVRAVEETDPSPPAMLLAGTLWVETALEPPSIPLQERIANRVIALQDEDGSFPGSSRHRASCLALVALSRVQDILPRDRNLG